MSIVTVITAATRVTVRRAHGLPPSSQRPGTWSPGTCAQVRRAVTAAALEAATARYFLDPNQRTWDDLMSAQVTADTAR